MSLPDSELALVDNYKYFSYPTSSISVKSIMSVHYKPISDHLQQRKVQKTVQDRKDDHDNNS